MKTEMVVAQFAMDVLSRTTLENCFVTNKLVFRFFLTHQNSGLTSKKIQLPSPKLIPQSPQKLKPQNESGRF